VGFFVLLSAVLVSATTATKVADGQTEQTRMLSSHVHQRWRVTLTAVELIKLR
jgi:hypothetical protein